MLFSTRGMSVGKKKSSTPCKKYLHGGMLIMDKDLDEKRILQKKIIKMVEKIENVWILSQILRCIQNITKEG